MEKQILLSVPLDEFKLLVMGWILESLKEFKQNESSLGKDLPLLLTRKQTANFLGISLVTLDNWTKDGKIQSYTIADHKRFKRDEVLKAIKEVKNLKYKRGR